MRGAHLWKRILNEGIECDCGTECRIKGDLPRLILVAPIFSLGQVAQVGEIEKAEAVIPFDTFWMEWSHPDEKLKGNIKGFVRGAFVTADSEKDGSFGCEMIALEANSKSRPTKVFEMKFSIGKNRRFVFSEPGKLSNLQYSNWFYQYPERDRSGDVTTVVAIVMDALTILGCKNIAAQPNPMDEQTAKRASRRTHRGPEYFKYHTLVVRPAGSKPGTPGQEIGIMPRHVCRGHFAEYGPEFGKGLLFGKYAGRFFVPPCVKGKKENGIVEKDYVIPSDASIVK